MKIDFLLLYFVRESHDIHFDDCNNCSILGKANQYLLIVKIDGWHYLTRTHKDTPPSLENHIWRRLSQSWSAPAGGTPSLCPHPPPPPAAAGGWPAGPGRRPAGCAAGWGRAARYAPPSPPPCSKICTGNAHIATDKYEQYYHRLYVGKTIKTNSKGVTCKLLNLTTILDLP